MEYIKADINSKYIDNLRHTMDSSFPDNEKLDIDKLLSNYKVDTYILLDSNEYIGFMTVANSERYSYLYFLAIDMVNRSKGYGGKALEVFKEISGSKIRLIDLDPQDEKAEDALNRKRRKIFYLRNGYYDINLGLEYLNMDLELISSIKERPNLDEVNEILRKTIKKDLVIKYKNIGDVPRETY